MSLAFCMVILITIRVTYGSTAIMTFLYMVVVPYSFLMNTSHNKNRIVEHGWKTVFNNILGMKQNLMNESENALSTISTDSNLKRDKSNRTRQRDIQRDGKPLVNNWIESVDASETDSKMTVGRQRHKVKEKKRSFVQYQEGIKNYSRPISADTEIRISTTKESSHRLDEAQYKIEDIE